MHQFSFSEMSGTLLLTKRNQIYTHAVYILV